MTADALQALDDFVAEFRFRPRRVTVDVGPATAARPVARLEQRGSAGRVIGYRLLTGPELADLEAYLTPTGVITPDHQVVGILNPDVATLSDTEISPVRGLRQRSVSDNPARWHVVQPGLPALRGRPVGPAAQLIFHPVTRGVEGLANFFTIAGPVTAAAFLSGFTVGFAGPGSNGFTVRRRALSKRFEVRVDDPRVDRRLVLAAVTALAESHTDSVGETAAALAAPFVPRSGG